MVLKLILNNVIVTNKYENFLFLVKEEFIYLCDWIIVVARYRPSFSANSNKNFGQFSKKSPALWHFNDSTIIAIRILKSSKLTYWFITKKH